MSNLEKKIPKQNLDIRMKSDGKGRAASYCGTLSTFQKGQLLPTVIITYYCCIKKFIQGL